MSTTELERVTKDIVDKLRKHYSPSKIVLFGSHADGTANANSDLDLLIITETSDRFMDRWTTVQRILTDRNRRFGIDTLVMTPKEVSDRLEIGDQFVEEIIAKGKVLYAA